MKNNITSVTLIIVILWLLNEGLQYFSIFKNLDFITNHASSFYGAVIFNYWINKLKLSSVFFVFPIIVEILHSYLQCKCFDYMDVLFSFCGILFSLKTLYVEKNGAS